jgi:hypothetical protein
MEILLKAVTVTYTRTFTFIPTTEYFADREDAPDQESVKFYAFENLFSIIHDEIAGPKNPMPHTTIKKLEKGVKINWEGIE